MTKKLRLATEYCELHRIFDGPSFNEHIYNPENIARKFTVADLETKIDSVKSAIVQKQHKEKIEHFYTTPEGIQFKAEREAMRNSFIEQNKEIVKTFTNWLNDEIQSEYGNKWISDIRAGSYDFDIEIGIRNCDSSRPVSKFEFGLSFTIRFDSYNFGKGTPKFEMNYGTLGSFDILNDKNRKMYLYGMGCMSSDKMFLQTLLKKCNEYQKTIKANMEQIYALDEIIADPFDL